MTARTERRIAFATADDVGGITDDDRTLVEPLAQLATVVPACWHDPTIDWSRFDAVIVRSTWGYHLQLERFLAWSEAVEKLDVALWNPAETLRWNSHKTYLRQLAADGHRVVPTVWLERASKPSLGELLAEQGWSQAVLKPSVSASAYRTTRVSARTAASDQASLMELLARGPALLQPYLEQIETSGEWSLLFFDGRFSHAVRKLPKAGDFRVQRELGGRTEAAEPPTDHISRAEAVVRSIDPLPLYARIDGVEVDGVFALMEAELIEPELFLRHDPQAPARLAAAIGHRLASR